MIRNVGHRSGCGGLMVLAEADAGDFVSSRRLEEVWPGYSWRSALSPGYLR
jgi:hypothetical protein